MANWEADVKAERKAKKDALQAYTPQATGITSPKGYSKDAQQYQDWADKIEKARQATSFIKDRDERERYEAQGDIAQEEMAIQKETRQNILRAMGYDLEARPYEFDESKYTSQFLPEQLARLEREKGNVLAGIQGMAGPQAEFRDTQSYLTNLLTRAAEGQGPSMVEPAYRKALDESIAASRASALASGLSPAMAARAGIEATGKTATEAAGQAALMKAQEQQQARAELASVAASARAGDLTLADNQQKYLQDMTQYYLNQGFDLENAQYEAGMRLEEQKAQQHAQAQSTLAGASQGGGGSVLGDVLGGVASFGASLFGSDINLKENIEDADSDVKSFLDKLIAKKYNYVGDEDEKVGIVAQDMEKSNMGKKAVVDTDSGFKAIDMKETLPLLLASVANLNKRLKKVEE